MNKSILKRRAPVAVWVGDSEMTEDPSTVNCRIFLGNVDSTLNQEDFRDYFSQFGRVAGFSRILRNKFCFLQYDSERGATACAAAGSTASIGGKLIEIRIAKNPEKKANDASKQGKPAANKKTFKRNESEMSSNVRRQQQQQQQRPFFGSPQKKRDSLLGDGDLRNSIGFRGASSTGGLPQKRRRFDNAPTGDGGSSFFGSLGNDFSSGQRFRAPSPPALMQQQPSIEPRNSKPLLDAKPPNNVCEIVVASKFERDYAEEIENQLRRLMISVDLLFPPENVSIERMLADLSERGSLYAIFITGENRQHRSISFFFLQEPTQEHRNMPIEDALLVIERDWVAYNNHKSEARSRDNLLSETRSLLMNFLDGETLAQQNIEKIIKFFQLQLDDGGADAGSTGLMPNKNEAVREDRSTRRSLLGAPSSSSGGLSFPQRGMDSFPFSGGEGLFNRENDRTPALLENPSRGGPPALLSNPSNSMDFRGMRDNSRGAGNGILGNRPDSFGRGFNSGGNVPSGGNMKSGGNISSLMESSWAGSDNRRNFGGNRDGMTRPNNDSLLGEFRRFR